MGPPLPVLTERQAMEIIVLSTTYEYVLYHTLYLPTNEALGQN